METVKTNYPDEVVSAGQLLRMLNTDAREISTLCQKACLRPKKDGFGNIYFSKGDVDILRKIKELHEHSKNIRQERQAQATENVLLSNEKNTRLEKNSPTLNSEKKLPSQNIEKTMPVQNRENYVVQSQNVTLIKKMENLENSVVNRLTDVLSEKLDGLDEVIVELIKAKTENETLRQKVNELNKENFSLKTENSSYKKVALGLYVKKQTDDFTF